MPEQDKDHRYAFPVAPSGARDGTAVIPGKATLTERINFGPFQGVAPKPDERPLQDDAYIDWAALAQRTPPLIPFRPIAVVPPAEVCPPAPRARSEYAPTHHQPDTNPVRDDAAARPHNIMNAAREGLRQKRWDAYRVVAQGFQNQQNDAAPHIIAVQLASQDPDLAALGFTLPPHFLGTLDQAADRQRISGVVLEQLFTHNSSLALTQHDIRAATHARDGSTDYLSAIAAADAKVGAATARVAGHVKRLHACALDVEVVRTAILIQSASRQVEAATAEIAALTARAAEVGEALSFFSPHKVLELAEKVAGVLQDPGSLSAAIYNLVTSTGLAAAQAKLADAQARVVDLREHELEVKLRRVEVNSSAELDFLVAARADLASALADRQHVYGSVGRRIGGDKIASLLTALPVAELVYEKLATVIAKTTTPACTDDAGRGFAIGVYNHIEESLSLPGAIGVMQSIHNTMLPLADKWNARMLALTAHKRLLMGVTPQDVVQ